MSDDEFIERHASGTLRKNRRLGMAWHSQYLHERVAFEFGWGFMSVPASAVRVGQAETHGDVAALTEAGWLCDRHIATRPFDEDDYAVHFIEADHDGARTRGVGLVLRATSASFIPDGQVVFAIVAPLDDDGAYGDAENPS